MAIEEYMALGREELLMREADVHKQMVVKSNNKDRVGLTSVELSHLHQQLGGITTTCTLIIGFAMAALSADLLGALGDPTGQFCLYKSIGSMVVAGLFIVTCTTCVCACFTVIACVQIIIFQSQRAIFSRSMVARVKVAASQSTRQLTRAASTKSVNVTWRVVRMTQLLIYGDRTALWDASHPSDSFKKKTKAQLRKEINDRSTAIGGFTIYMGLGIALACFFASTIIVILIFVSPLASWRTLDTDASSFNNTNFLRQDHVFETSDNRIKTRCLDPYDPADERHMLILSSIISIASTIIFCTNVVIGVRTALACSRCFELESLLSLQDEEQDVDETTVERQQFEDEIEHLEGQLDVVADRVPRGRGSCASVCSEISPRDLADQSSSFANARNSLWA